jgi:TetR/AcrR family transcriptional regulator, transcriptional repressor for nem operon
MGRSSYEQAAKNRLKILQSATRLFREHGVDNVSVADLMNATGMTTGGFYKHFKSKEALAQEVFLFAFNEAANEWRRASERKYDDPGDRAAALVDFYFQKRPARWTCPMIAFAPHVSSDASQESSSVTYRKCAEDLFSQFVEHMRKSRPEQDLTSDCEIRILFAAMVGAQVLAQATDASQWIQSVQDAVRKGAAMLGDRNS